MTHVVPGRRPAAEALRAGRPVRELVLAREDGDLGPLAEQARERDVVVRTASRDELDVLAQGVLHQGAVAVCPPPTPTTIEALADTALVVVLDGITDPQNLGAIARSAETAGCGGLVVAKRRSATVTPAAEKASAGALSWLPVATVPNLVRALARLAEGGLWSVGLDGEAPTGLWDCALLDERVALVVGSEGRGLSRLVRERADMLVSIPMAGRIGSLNASAATAVALAEVVRRRHARAVR